MSFRSDSRAAAHTAGGSYRTVEAREAVAGRLSDFLQAKNIQIHDLAHLKTTHVQQFASARMEAGISTRTLQNEITAIRTMLRAVGREKLASNLDNKRLGIAGASRDGTKTALPDERFAALRAAVEARDEGVAAVVDLQRALGLRAEEAVKSCKSLATWERQLDAGRPVRLIYGSKGGRARDIRPADTQRALEAVRAALRLSKAQGGVLIAKENAKAAMKRYSNVMSTSGFVGRESGHSLRYAFAQDQIAAYQQQGFTKDEALAQTSLDLGHGDGRGRWIEQVYSR